MEGEGSAFVTCSSIDYNTSLSCNNDECSDAFPVLTDGTPSTSIDVSNYTYTSDVDSECSNGHAVVNDQPDSWYSFIAPASGMVKITVDNSNLAAGSYESEGAIYSSCTVAGNCVAPWAYDDYLENGNTITGLIPGATYYLVVSNQDDYGGTAYTTGTFDVIIEDLTTPLSLGLKQCSYSFNYPSITDEICAYSCSDLADFDGEAVFTYTPATNQIVDISVLDISLPTSGAEVMGFILTDDLSGSSCLAQQCNQPANSADLTQSGISLIGGTTYFLIVNIDGSTSSPEETFCVKITSPCGTINNVTTPFSDCSSQTYTSRFNFSSFGGGAVTYNIEDDNGNAFTNISASTNYDFNFTDLLGHLVQVKGFDVSSNLVCVEEFSVTSGCNGTDAFSLSSPDILGTCFPGDLSSATNEGSFGDNGPYSVIGGVNGFSNNYTDPCDVGGGNDNNVDYSDIWYQVDLPDGTDEMTLSISGLGAAEYLGYALHTGPLSTRNDDNMAVADGTMEASFFSSSVTSHLISGLAAESTSPIYIRIYAADPNSSQSCASIIKPSSFTICATAPQANDICNDALPINDALGGTFLPVIQSGDISLSNIDTETSPNLNGTSCDGPLMTTSEEDLWYVIETPATGNWFVELTIDYTGVEDEIYVVLEDYCASGNAPIGCASISVDGTILFDYTNITNFENALTAANSYHARIVLPNGSTATSFNISANLIAENNLCDPDLSTVLSPTFNIGTNKEMNFNFSAASGVIPTIAGDDLYYRFSPVTATDVYGFTTASTSAQIIIGGLDAGEEVTLVVYKAEGITGNNCDSLAGNYLETLVANGNGTYDLSCLDELHIDEYIVRVIQTAGGTIIDNGLIRAEPQPAGPYNNDCENIWSEILEAPAGLGAIGEDATTNFNPYVILPGFSNFRSGDFENATDCNPDIPSSVCNGVDQQAILANEDRDLWYAFYIPAENCASTGLTVSSVINSVTFLYNAGASNEDAILYVYSDCDGDSLLDCSGALDGAPSGAGDDQFNDAQSTWTVSGLEQDKWYLLRVKPHDISSSGVFNEFDFDVSWKPGAVRPCNDDSPEDLNVETCNDYDGLPTWSMQGASESPSTGVPENDVWFTFTAPSPANGGPYFNANKSWVSVFFENVSGSSGGLTLQLYDAPSSIVATSNSFSAGSNAGDQGFAHFGHLNPGQTYYLRLYSKVSETVPVQYKLNVYTPNANESAWQCGNNTDILTSGCSEGCNDLREAYFKIDLPVGTASNQYYMIEVVGQDQILDFELRSQYLTESSANEGDIDDFDLPCSSRPLEPGVSIISETIGITTTTSGGSCNTNGIAADGGSGVRRVYFGMNGPATGMKDYYYIKVFMDPSDPNYATTTGLKICQINFNGPYSTEAIANAGGAIDGGCTPTALGVELQAFEGFGEKGVNKLSWETATESNNSHFILESSEDGHVFSRIGVVEGKGSSYLVSHYDFNHTTTAQQTYYRLTQVDFDGTETKSQIIIVEKSMQELRLYPNPSKNGGTINLSSNKEIQSFRITSLSGQVLIENQNLNETSTNIDLSLLNHGIYLVNATMNGKVKTVRLVID